MRNKKTIIIFIILILYSNGFAQKADLISTRWALGIGGGWYGIPKIIMNKLVYESPALNGNTYFIKISYEEGIKSFISTVFQLSFVYEKMSGSGIWQYKKNWDSIKGSIDLTQYSTNVSAIFNFFNNLPLNPYTGIGLGVGKLNIFVKGQLVKDIDVEEQDEIGIYIPFFYMPIGLRLKINDIFDIKIETGFQNGFYLSGILSVYL
jgi:hypothetical protein